MQWAEGWATDDALESSFNEGDSSMAPSANSMDESDGAMKERLTAVADELAYPRTRSVRDALRSGEELYDEGVRLWENKERDRAGAALMHSITVCQDALGDALDSMEEEELEAQIAVSEKQLTLAREHGWATHDDDTGAGLPPAGPHVLHPGGVDPFAPNGGSYEDDYDQEDFEGSGDEFGTGVSDGDMPQPAGVDFPITVSHSTSDSGDDNRKGGRTWTTEMPWPPTLQANGPPERSRSTEPRLQGRTTLDNGWQLMQGGGATFGRRDFDEPEYADRIAYRPHSMYDSLRSSLNRTSPGRHKANTRAHGVYSDLSVVRMALGGPPPAAAALSTMAALERPTERAGGTQGNIRRRGGRHLPSPGLPRSGTETEISVAHSTAHLLERSVEDLCPELTTPRRKGWAPVRLKRSPGSHTPLQASTLRTTHGGSWSVPNYQTRNNLRHPRSTVNAFRAGTPSSLSRTVPRRPVRPHINMYAESRPWRNGLADGYNNNLSNSERNTKSHLKEDQRQILFTMKDITRDAEAAAKLKLQKRAEKLEKIGASKSPPRASIKARRDVSPQKTDTRKRRLKRARELKEMRDAQKKQLEVVDAESDNHEGGNVELQDKCTDEAAEVEVQSLRIQKSGSFSVRWNDKLERSLVEEKQQKAKLLMFQGLNEEERLKIKVSPHMSYLARLTTNAKLSYDEGAVKVKPMPCVLGAVALTDSGQQRASADAQKKQDAAMAYAEKIQEILDKAQDRQQDDGVEALEHGENRADGGNSTVLKIVDLTMPESTALLDQHPGASERGAAFGRVEEAQRCLAMVHRTALLTDWPSADIKLKAGSAHWDGWRPKNGMLGEILHRWDWDKGLWLLKIAGQPDGLGIRDVVDQYCVMPSNACASVRVLGMRTISVDLEENDE